MQHYTHIGVVKGEMVIRSRHPETRVAEYHKVDYQPTTYTTIEDKAKSNGWRTLDGEYLRPKRHESVRSYHAYVKSAEENGYKPVYGAISPVTQYMAETIQVPCGLPLDGLRVAYIDIEVGSAGGFAPPDDPFQPITAITVHVWDKTFVWGTGTYTPPADQPITYFCCKDEAALLKSFIRWWSEDYPDIVTGWNTHTYDIPYIVNRITRLNAEKLLKVSPKALSPWREITTRKTFIQNRPVELVELVGIAILDYLELYQKYAIGQRESYRLDAIAELELGERKVSYEEYGSLQKLAEENYQLFIEYNIQDVLLVTRLNKKLKYLDLCVRIAYNARVNFTDTFKQVRLWDCMIYYHLYDQKIAIPANMAHHKDSQYTGAYVKEPLVGQHKWVVSFDVNSLYPTIMRQWNISPECHLSEQYLKMRLGELGGPVTDWSPTSADLVPQSWIDTEPENEMVVRWALGQLIDTIQAMTMDSALRNVIQSPDAWPWLRVLQVAMSPNRQVFRVDKQGFLSVMLETLYQQRKAAKNKETALKKEAEQVQDATEKARLLQQAADWGLEQNTRKINLNSSYGAFGNAYFRFYDPRQAEAVTTCGQVIIRYVAEMINDYLNREYGSSERKKDFIIASDTDSVYVTLAQVVGDRDTNEGVDFLDTFCETVLQKIIDTAFETLATVFNTPDHLLAMKREAIAEYGLWTGAKYYVLWVHDQEGVRYAQPKLKITGLEAVRSSTPKYARNIIKKGIELFVRQDRDGFYALLNEAERYYETAPFSDIAIPKSCHGLNEYPILPTGEYTPKTPYHVRAALVYNLQLDQTGLGEKYPRIRAGEKVRCCYLLMGNPVHSNIIAAPHILPPEWKLESYLDRSTQFEKTILSPLEKVIRWGGWTIRPIVTLDF